MNVITQFPATRDYDHDLHFRAVFEGAAIGIGICRLDGRMVEANPALGRMLGYSLEELTGTQGGNLFPELHPEFRGEAGREIHSGNFSSEEGLLGELIREERGGVEIEKSYRRKDGTELWGRLTVSVGRDARRQPAFLIYVLADATERKRVEEHLRAAEKMEAIGRLAGGISHDFNNLLTGILLYCDLLSAGLESAGLQSSDPTSMTSANRVSTNLGSAKLGWCSGEFEGKGSQWSEMCKHVDEVRMASEQGAALTRQLLAIARKQAAQPRPILINEIVASTEDLLRRLIGEQIELVTALDSGAGLVLADPAQLRQVLLNLVLNARDAMPQGGKIRLITRAAEFPGGGISGEVCGNGDGVNPRRAASLAVQDNGCGMDAETRARLFEPFFTTKKSGEGTGLGLATVQRIVTESGGRIEVESEPGRGTCIEVLLPAIELPAEQPSMAESAAGSPSIPSGLAVPTIPCDGAAKVMRNCLKEPSDFA